MNEDTTISIPLLHEGDAFALLVQSPSPGTTHVRLSRILRYAGNQNVAPDSPPFHSLDARTRGEIVKQVQRKFPGLEVRV